MLEEKELRDEMRKRDWKWKGRTREEGTTRREMRMTGKMIEKK